ncbi:MAG: nicotinamide mononucleotide transporter [Alistipes sp.]|nr:nicotinamide mononucleotide transporter [Alistipes sp.]
MQYVEILGTVVGLLYLWLEYRASIYLWVASVVMPAIYLFVYYDAGLYADFGINLYYLIIAIYGWAAWRYGFSLSKGRQDQELEISDTPARLWLSLSALTTLLLAAIAWILIRFTDSTVPYADAFTTALSVVGMWLLARKYIEQWWVWLVVDVASVALYIYKDLHFTAVLYALYAVVAIFGYRKWKELMNKQDEKR